MKNHLLLAASAALSLSLAGCGAPEAPAAPARAVTPNPFDAAYADASAATGVPAALLRGIAVAQTGEHMVTDSEAGQHGLMGLSDEAIAEAAAHLGLDTATIETDAAANVRAAAWIVADRRAQGDGWNAAALALTGIRDANLRARWVLKFNRVFEAAGTTPEAAGEGITPQSYSGSADYGPAAWVPAYSGNYTAASRTHSDLYYVVIHDIEGTYESAISWFQNPSAQVSAHFVTSNEGDLTQMVSISDIAWHAGNWTYNEHSVGIEHEGYASDPSSYPETMYEASATLTRWLCDTYIISRDRNHIIGHVEVPGSTHHDPGPYWDWDHYMELVNNGVALHAKLVGYVRVGDIYTGAPIAGATVTLDGGATATTDADGYYEFDGLDLGTYTVTATADGYDSAVDSKAVDSNTTYWKSLALEPTADPGQPGQPGDPGNPATGGSHKSGCDAGGFEPANWGASLLALAALAALFRRRPA